MACGPLRDGGCVRSSIQPAETCPISPVDNAGLHGSKIPEMDSVVATITGYVGDERSNLIRLINSSGGFYVGNLRRAQTTHLVCWTFDGKKYEMAKKFGIYTINHRWFEDCVKAGRRLCEGPYTMLSGKDVGAVLWKEPNQKSNFAQHAKREVAKTHAKAVCNERLLPSSAVAEGFCQEEPNHDKPSASKTLYLAFQRTVSEGSLDSINNDQDLQILLNNNSKKTDKRKRKGSLILKNQSLKYKTPKKRAKKPSLSPIGAGQRKYGSSRNRISCSILDYVSISDENDADTNQNTPLIDCGNHAIGVPVEHTSPKALFSINPMRTTQVEETEDCSPVTSTRRITSLRKGKQLSLSRFDSMRHRKKRRLVKKTDVKKPVGSLDGTIEVGCPQSSIRAMLSTEILKHEPASPQVPCRADATCGIVAENFGKSPVACTLAPSDIACVICHIDKIASAEGVLTCGHHFCYLCIKKWASEVASKTPTCPLCKAPFDMITKRDYKVGLDDKESSYEESVVLLGCGEKCSPEQLGESTTSLACIMCGIGDMEELLLICNGCGTRSAHSFCLDPPLPPIPNTPWFCGRCSQRRRTDTTWWYQLHLFGRRPD